ncbi:MAG: hypothetical protein ACYC1P_06590, partial [Gaiellaceae bacterium]
MLSRSAFRLVTLLLLLGVLLAGATGAARADAPDWRAALGLSAEDAVVASAADAKRRLAGVPGAEAVGIARLTPFVQEQIRKDVLLKAKLNWSRGEWHFFASSRSDSL